MKIEQPGFSPRHGNTGHSFGTQDPALSLEEARGERPVLVGLWENCAQGSWVAAMQ